MEREPPVSIPASHIQELDMTAHLEGKNIAVTGGGSGIGKAIALACADEGANIVVADYGVAMDGSDPSSEVADAVVAEITARGGSAVPSPATFASSMSASRSLPPPSTTGVRSTVSSARQACFASACCST